MAEGSRKLAFGALVVETSSEDKVLYPGERITKGDVIDYYRRVAAHALPHAERRFLTLQRFPDGIGKAGFFQQARPDYFPDLVPGKTTRRASDGDIEHFYIENAAGLVYLADQAAITFHCWLSRADRPRYPDRLVVDLDPPGREFSAVRDAALRTRDLFRELDLTPYVMTTGSKGLHVVVPLDRKSEFDEVRAFARQAAAVLARRHPESLTTSQRKSGRRGRVYLDVMRNACGQTAVMPYSLRAIRGAPVATPLSWRELKDKNLHARRYDLGNIFRRLSQVRDPWAGMKRHAASVSIAARTLRKLEAHK